MLDILASGLISKDGYDLSFEANEHLFQWPGELLFGSIGAIARGNQDVVLPEKDYEDFEYDRLGMPVEREKPETTEAPDLSPRELRQRFSIRSNPRRDQNGLRQGRLPISPPLTARPNPEAAQQAQGAMSDWGGGADQSNPLLERLKLRTLLADYPRGETLGDRTDGAIWVCEQLSIAILETSQGILPPHVVQALGTWAAGKVFAEYIKGDRRALEKVRTFENYTLAPAIAAAETKVSLIEAEIGKWAAAGRFPVRSPNGEPDDLLQAVNMTTALTGIKHLARLGQFYVDWIGSAAGATAAIVANL